MTRCYMMTVKYGEIEVNCKGISLTGVTHSLSRKLSLLDERYEKIALGIRKHLYECKWMFRTSCSGSLSWIDHRIIAGTDIYVRVDH